MIEIVAIIGFFFIGAGTIGIIHNVARDKQIMYEQIREIKILSGYTVEDGNFKHIENGIKFIREL